MYRVAKQLKDMGVRGGVPVCDRESSSFACSAWVGEMRARSNRWQHGSSDYLDARQGRGSRKMAVETREGVNDGPTKYLLAQQGRPSTGVGAPEVVVAIKRCGRNNAEREVEAFLAGFIACCAVETNAVL